MELYTVQTIAAECGEAVERVDHAVRRFGIEPVGRAGPVRLFDADGRKLILRALEVLPRRNRQKPVLA